ncbi:class II D-tagatose-bisphosphate aldolase non-catalytic subunit, partial [Rhizobium leguminosarum]|uniref:class II D-tagatose-bisphosphate aldolase non-catalytic subunit n=1 Tax=Rhizobium leguminosarum TaxID=384 RepID=UPI003F9591E1
CKGEPVALDDETTAHSAARLAAVAEASAKRAGGAMPVYVIGTEVPPPGGADHTLTTIDPTAAAAALTTIEVHRRIFAEAGLGQA